MSTQAAYRYEDPFVARLAEDMGALIVGECADRASILERLCALAERNAPAVASYWRRTGRGRGVPDAAFRGPGVYLFSDCPPARVFETSGTSGAARGLAACSPRGLELMMLSIVTHARRRLLDASGAPRAIVRLVPAEQTAPRMIMAYGMERIAEALGQPGLGGVVVDEHGVDLRRLGALLDEIMRAGVPAILIGASFAFVHVCEALEREGRRFALPAGSRVVDAGGFKGRSRVVSVDELRAVVARVLGIAPDGFVNIFGMTELASQLYDGRDVAVGPRGERPKPGLTFVTPRVRDPGSMALREQGPGLLEVVDLCILDRPCVVLTGDLGVATADGVAVIGRVARSSSRGCSLSVEALVEGGGS